MKAFIVNRVGDFGFCMLGIFGIWAVSPHFGLGRIRGHVLPPPPGMTGAKAS